jgi:hypothetical protein
VARWSHVEGAVEHERSRVDVGVDDGGLVVQLPGTFPEFLLITGWGGGARRQSRLAEQSARQQCGG